jgi:hypothetical protein
MTTFFNASASENTFSLKRNQTSEADFGSRRGIL